jgi:hypothetical protein
MEREKNIKTSDRKFEESINLSLNGPIQFIKLEKQNFFSEINDCDMQNARIHKKIRDNDCF